MRATPIPLRTPCGKRLSGDETWYRRQQLPSLGMLRLIAYLERHSLLHDTALVHHRDIIREVAHHVDVVRDEQVSQLQVSFNASSNWRSFACTLTSSALVSSSQTIKRGSSAMALAMPMRWCWPPENSCE